MRYESTRGSAPELGFADVLLAGLADDGGLYVPRAWPELTYLRRDDGGSATASYAALATELMWPFVAGAIDADAFESIVAETYATFDHPDVVPLHDLGDGLFLLELFHGPTLAFKDVALQLVGRLFDHELARRGTRLTIVGATSGDTGSAAIEACRDRSAIEIFILHPNGRVSDVQRRQMTTIDAANVHNVAIGGTFDDCQDLVKAMFADVEFRDAVHLGAVNSINWARVMAQIVYYFAAARRVAPTGSPVAFTVPTGNFGNVFAGYAAHRMGLAVEQLVVASNTNDVLTRLLVDNEMAIRPVVPTLSPSMDIQVSSNLERLLFELADRDGPAVADLLARFRADGWVTLPADQHRRLRGLFDGTRCDDAGTTAAMKEAWERHGLLVDPHTAVGLAAARASRRSTTTPMVVLATAHPAKFPDAVEAATGVRPALPVRLGDLMERMERFAELPADLRAVEDHVLGAVTSQ